MRQSTLPLFSTLNGPSYLLQAVDTLAALGLPAANLRLLPVIAQVTCPEVAPYLEQFAGLLPEEIHPEKLVVRLGINVRDDSRLRALLPLLAVGMPEPDALPGDGAALLQWYATQYARLDEYAPEWTNDETPAERLARQLCQQFPELREPGTPVEQSSEQIWVYRHGQRLDERNPHIATRDEIEEAPPTQQRTARELAEVLLTQVLLSIACADMLGGFEFELPIEPPERAVDIHLDGNSDITELVRWLQAYPHRPRPQIRFEMADDREKAEWEAYFQAHPERDNLLTRGASLWTIDDPGVQAMHAAIRRLYGGERTEPLSSGQILRLAQRYLPEYTPHYPHQFAVTGGLNLEGIALTLISGWLRQGRFLGMGWEEWQLFSLNEQAILCALLIHRGHLPDQSALFEIGVRLFGHPGIQTWVEDFRPEPARLGAPLAQLGRTFALGGASALHAPEMVVRIPLDRTEDEEGAEKSLARLDVIRRLFLPVHVPVRYLWQVDRPILGVSTYLQNDNAPVGAGLACRLPAY